MKINTYTKILNNAVAAYALNNAIAKIEIFKDRALGSWRSFFLNKKLEINKNGTLIKRPRIQYNPSKCDQCGDCVNSCPYNMLKTTDNPKLPIAGFCTLCGQCIETCPEKALSYK